MGRQVRRRNGGRQRLDWIGEPDRTRQEREEKRGKITKIMV